MTTTAVRTLDVRGAGATKVVVADDNQLFRAGLSALLTREPDFEVVGEVSRGDEAVAAALRTSAQVVVAELRLPVLDGIAVGDRLRRHSPRTAVLVLTTGSRPDELDRAMDRGVRGFLRKDVPPAQLLAGLRQVRRGSRVIDVRLSRDRNRVATDRVERGSRGAFRLTPTARELAVLRLVASGASNKEVALSLGLSAGTVRNYMSSVIAKARARNRLDAVRVARENGWL